MKSKYAIIGIATGVALLLTGPGLYAQSQNGIGQVNKVNEVYGNQVVSSDNQKIGNLNNLMVDLESGRILYGIVATRQGRVAVAPQVFTQTVPSNKEIHVNVTAAKIEGAPKYTAAIDKPGQWQQASFVDSVYSYFGQSPWWQGSTPANQGTFHNVHKASVLLGMPVINVQNAPLGKVNNLAVDLPAGRLVYVLLQPDSSLNLGNNLYVLPPQAFTWNTSHDRLESGITAQQLAAGPHFPSNQWPNLSDTTLASQAYQHYGKQPYFQATPTGR